MRRAYLRFLQKNSWVYVEKEKKHGKMTDETKKIS